MDVDAALALAADVPPADKHTMLVALTVLADEVRRLRGETATGYQCRCGASFAGLHGFKVHVGRLGAHAHGVARIGRVTGAETAVQAQARIAAAEALYADPSPRRSRR